MPMKKDPTGYGLTSFPWLGIIVLILTAGIYLAIIVVSMLAYEGTCP